MNMTTETISNTSDLGSTVQMNATTELITEGINNNTPCSNTSVEPSNDTENFKIRQRLLLELEHIQKCEENPVIRYIILGIVCFTIASTFFGNILIIVSHIRNKRFRESNVYKLLLQVAISDLILGIFLLKFPISEIFPGVLESYTACIVRVVLVTTSMASSILFLSVVSIDRFMAILFPFKHLIDSKKGRKFIIVTLIMWAFCITGGFMLISQNKFLKYNLQDAALRSCPINWVVDETYSNLSALLMAFSIVINSILYACVLRRILNRRKISNSASVARTVARTKLTISVHVVFAVCWVPCLTIVFLVWAFPDNLDLKCYREHAITLGYLNSGLNWILYGIANKIYRDEFKLILCCCCRKEVAIRSHPSKQTLGTQEGSLDSQSDKRKRSSQGIVQNGIINSVLAKDSVEKMCDKNKNETIWVGPSEMPKSTETLNENTSRSISNEKESSHM